MNFRHHTAASIKYKVGDTVYGKIIDLEPTIKLWGGIPLLNALVGDSFYFTVMLHKAHNLILFGLDIKIGYNLDIGRFAVGNSDVLGVRNLMSIALHPKSVDIITKGISGYKYRYIPTLKLFEEVSETD
jgi:hypothetical protein